MKLMDIHKILFITLSNIGDVILTLPVLSALRQNFPNAKLDVVVGYRPKEIFTKDPRINQIFIYDKNSSLKGKLGFLEKLRSEKYDLAVDMKRSLIPILIGAKNRSSLISGNKRGVRHKRLVHLGRLEGLGIETKTEKNIYVDIEDREKVKKLLEENGVRKDDVLIGVSPSCRSLLKEWHVEGFIEVIRVLLEKGNCKIVLIGDESQVNRVRKITSVIQHKNLIDFTGKTNLNELFALIDSMYVLLTCDSASMHIASECGVKVVAIFGPTDPKEYGPTGENDIVVRKDLKCSPCRRAVCRFKHECMREIGAGEVLEAVEKIAILLNC